jgi:hypothetical protein
MVEAVPLSPFRTGGAATIHQAPMPPYRTDEEKEEYKTNPRQFMLDRCALFMKNMEVFHNWVITATYYLPDHLDVAGGHKIYLPDSTHDEALWQGKVGLVIGKGPLAFRDSPHIDFCGQNIEIGDWVQYDILEGRQFTIDQVHCRRLKDTQIVMRVGDPRLVY